MIPVNRVPEQIKDFHYIKKVSNWQSTSPTHSTCSNCSSASTTSSRSLCTECFNELICPEHSTGHVSSDDHDSSLEAKFKDVRLNIDDLIQLQIDIDDSDDFDPSYCYDQRPALCAEPARKVRKHISNSASCFDIVPKLSFRLKEENHENAKNSLRSRLVNITWDCNKYYKHCF